MAKKRCYLFVKRDGKNKRCHLIANGNKVLYIDDTIIPKVTFSISPTPSDASVKFYATGYKQSGNSISVVPNTSITWKVSKPGYREVSNTLTLTEDIINYPVSIEEILYKLDVENYTYRNDNGYITLTNYTGSGETIKTPNVEEE